MGILGTSNGSLAKQISSSNNSTFKTVNNLLTLQENHVEEFFQYHGPEFLAALEKLMDDPKLADIPLRIKMQRAATATNDMYGGLNWMQLYRDTTDPFLRELKKHAYTPKGRRYMQLGLFAPDWTTANYRVLASAMPGIGKVPLARKLYQAYALRAGIILATGGSALQYMFTGKTLWQNDDPTRVNLGNGYSLTLSKQYFEPLHWATAPVKTALSKQGSTLKLAEQFFFNKQKRILAHV